jgi:ATP/maltotriose-dependent transcriptional regulator MalT
MALTDPNAADAQPLQPDAQALLEQGRAAFERRDWNDAFEALSVADRHLAFDASDLQRLAWAAGMTARDDAMLSAQERVYYAHLDAGQSLPAARAAFWLGFRLLAHGELGRSSGWLARSQRLVEMHGAECVEQGYLLLPAAQRRLSSQQLTEAHDTAARAVEIGERFGECDLAAFGRNLQGRVLLAQGNIERGLALMDEAMLAATAGELSPVVTGIVYCSAIASCHRVYALSRVREWTAALSKWCEAHPQLAMFTAHCHVHRAEMFELGGSWSAAVEEARRVVERCVRDIEREAAGRAHYQEGEIHRLRGEFSVAEEAYRNASRCGIEPQPGLALLRLAQGDRDAAANAVRRMLSATADPLQRTRFLPAKVEIMLAAGELDEASSASQELKDCAASLSTDVLAAIADHASAAVDLARGKASEAVDPARRAFRIWQQLGAPYLAARLRVLLARACARLGDAESARLELGSAREVFEQLGAQPDLAFLDRLEADLTEPGQANAGVKLTEREFEVLRLLSTGKTNKAIARELTLSEKTVDRHVSNIFTKLDVSSRAAATAYAYEHRLI